MHVGKAQWCCNRTDGNAWFDDFNFPVNNWHRGLQFVANWAEGDNSFADNPPNAVLSFAEPGDRLPEDAVVVIQDPRLDGDALTYSIKLLDGTVPTATGPCALFIDPFGRPLSPVSAAGMHRRARRRRMR